MIKNMQNPDNSVIKSTEMQIQPKSESDSISISEFSAFTGKSDYPKLWMNYKEGKTRFAGFNQWAFLFGIQWFFFRKLYPQGLISILLEVGVPIGLVMVLRQYGGTKILQMFDGYIIYLIFLVAIAVRVAIGFWANIALYNKAVEKITKTDSLNLDNEMHLKTISKAGGVSIESALVIYAVAILAQFIFKGIR